MLSLKIDFKLSFLLMDTITLLKLLYFFMYNFFLHFNNQLYFCVILYNLSSKYIFYYLRTFKIFILMKCKKNICSFNIIYR